MTLNPASLSRALPQACRQPRRCPIGRAQQLQLSGHCPCHLPGHGGRRTLAVLAPPVQTRRSECAQPGCHGSSSWRPGSGSDRRASDPQPWNADAAERPPPTTGGWLQGCLSPCASGFTLHAAISKGQWSQLQIERILFLPWGQHSEREAASRLGRALSGKIPNSTEVRAVGTGQDAWRSQTAGSLRGSPTPAAHWTC